MWLISFFSFIIGLCSAILLPFLACILFIGVYSLPYLLWAAFAIRKPNAPKDFKYEAGPIKTFFRATRFYFQLITFKKPSLK